MPKNDVGGPKWLANKMKSKGLQKLRWFCQMCEKQCRDENGFKCHVRYEPCTAAAAVLGNSHFLWIMFLLLILLLIMFLFMLSILLLINVTMLILFVLIVFPIFA